MSVEQWFEQQRERDELAAQEESAFWSSCSGCTESDDGDTSALPRHPVHGCAVGIGCFECNYRGIALIHLGVS